VVTRPGGERLVGMKLMLGVFFAVFIMEVIETIGEFLFGKASD
jgi:hypothetical protein